MPAGFWNSINVDRYSILPTKSDLYFDDEAYQDRKVVFCRHPFGEYANDLYSLENIKPVVLFREPLDWLTSYYTKYGKKRFDSILKGHEQMSKGGYLKELLEIINHSRYLETAVKKIYNLK